MDERRSVRLAEKAKRKADADGDGAQRNRRDSVGGALGVTPKKGAKGNLHQAKAADAAAAAAARLDAFGAEAQRGITKRKKRRKSQKKRRRRSSYAASIRESMDLLAKTAKHLESEEGSSEEKEDGEAACRHY